MRSRNRSELRSKLVNSAPWVTGWPEIIPDGRRLAGQPQPRLQFLDTTIRLFPLPLGL